MGQLLYTCSELICRDEALQLDNSVFKSIQLRLHLIHSQLLHLQRLLHFYAVLQRLVQLAAELQDQLRSRSRAISHLEKQAKPNQTKPKVIN